MPTLDWELLFTTALLDGALLQVIALGFVGGLLSALLPCNLALAPLVLSYIGLSGSAVSPWVRLLHLLLFTLGLACTFSVLGLLAALLGITFGAWLQGGWLYGILGVICLGLGLQLGWNWPFPTLALGLSRLPAWACSPGMKGLAPFLIGLAFGLVASPCGTPVLLALLAYVGHTQDAVLGAFGLFFYALGQSSVLVLLGLFGFWLKKRVWVQTQASRIAGLLGSFFLMLLGLWFLGQALFPMVQRLG